MEARLDEITFRSASGAGGGDFSNGVARSQPDIGGISLDWKRGRRVGGALREGGVEKEREEEMQLGIAAASF